MKEIVSGVTVMTEFCGSSSKLFGNYIEYINRDEATRTKNFDKFNIYNDYMGNPKKSSGLFTKTKDKLTEEEKQELKDVFQTAQDNGSLMWQTVISFDNRWLAEHGLYDLDTRIIHEKTLQRIVRASVEKMLEKENLGNAVWSAGFHFNTDNLHVHIATVEPIPTREKRTYIQRDEKGNALYDEKGNIKKVTEYKGRFKQSSIEACKSSVVNQIIREQNYNREINQLVRDTFLKQKKETSIEKDKDLSEQFLKIYNMLPEISPNLWKYGSNNMRSVRPELDKLTLRYLEKYHKEEFAEFKRLSSLQSEQYREAYGKKGNQGRDFAKGKMEDLKKRMGNAILQEMVNHSQNIEKIQEEIELGKERRESEYKEEKRVLEINPSEIENLERQDSEDTSKNEKAQYFLKWTKEYTTAKKMLNGTKDVKKDSSGAIKIFKEEERKGNVLADLELGQIYQFGIGVEKNKEISEAYYKKGFERLTTLKNNPPKMKDRNLQRRMEAQVQYKLGKCYELGRGVEQKYQEAKKAFEIADMWGNAYATFSLAGMYHYGNGVEKDLEKAFSYYQKTTEKIDFPFAHYQIGRMLESGIGTEIDEGSSMQHYKKALKGFVQMNEKLPDAKLQYRIGIMYLNGLGEEKNEEKGIEYLLKAAEMKNADAQYALAKQYLEKETKDKIEEGVRWLRDSAENGNVYAQCRLAKECLKGEYIEKDVDAAEKWLKKAVDKEYQVAEYILGSEYLSGKHFEKRIDVAERLLTKAAEKGNEYAQYKLGKEYLNGENLKKDIGASEYWAKLSAENGNTYAQYMLGKEYVRGENYKKNVNEGVKYLKSASEKENHCASYMLGKMYYYGDQINKNEKIGIQYLKLAAEQGNDYASNMLVRISQGKGKKQSVKHIKGKMGYELECAMRAMKRALNDESQKMRNMREHEKLMEKANRDKELDRE